MVAKGVLAKALRRLEEGAARADVVYVCSNADIARQNLARLRIDELDGDGFQAHGRLTLMPLIPLRADGSPVRKTALKPRGVNFLSLTPGTSLDIGRDVGQSLERALLCCMLQGQVSGVSDARLRNLFTSRTSTASFDNQLERIRSKFFIDPTLRRRFLARIGDRRQTLKEDLVNLSESFKRSKTYRHDDAEQRLAFDLIGRLRTTLASVCIEAVEPDLIILDEFQRFTHLLATGAQEVALAKQMFDFEHGSERARILLLSATPYRMCSLGEDPGDTQHYDEFIATVRFLFNGDPKATEALEQDLVRFNALLRSLDLAQMDTVVACRQSIERRLCRVIARTDRVPATLGRDAMISVSETQIAPSIDDLVAYVNLKRVADLLEQPDLIEYWRSAAYPLSFLSGYKLRDRLLSRLEQRDPALQAALQTPGLFLPAGGEAASGGSPANARARALALELIGDGMHRLLWLPPALPHYVLGGPFAVAGEAARTKRLLFSSWRMVPRSVSVVVDEAFGCAIGAQRDGTVARRHEAVAGDYTLGLPCWTLATAVSPSKLAMQVASGGLSPTFETLVAAAIATIEPLLGAVQAKFGSDDGAAADHDWYWLGPLLLDGVEQLRLGHAPEAIAASALDMSLVDEEATAEGLTTWPRQEHEVRRERCMAVLAGQSKLGRMPADILPVLAGVAIAGPATCALRALGGGSARAATPAMRQAASAVAASVLHYFGNERAVGLLTALYEEPAFWRRVLTYCGHGCLQAVLDEYVAVLQCDRPSSAAIFDRALEMAAAIGAALRLKPAVLRPEVLEGAPEVLQLQPVSRTLRHARPLLEDKSDGDGLDGPTLLTDLRAAFNSPFLPFVLSSTSIGQEGLDFHWYCHAIVHWNLPSNPVDFEQRDGRIHRYRNHAVRRNVALDWGAVALRQAGPGVWPSMFDAAARELQRRDCRMGGVLPSWIYRHGDCETCEPGPRWMRDGQGQPANIDRYIPAIPMSRDTERLEQLAKAVGCYRMVFAQPRQDDLLAHLERMGGRINLAERLDELAIDLRPPCSPRDEPVDRDMGVGLAAQNAAQSVPSDKPPDDRQLTQDDVGLADV
jgi:hypothetical protein